MPVIVVGWASCPPFFWEILQNLAKNKKIMLNSIPIIENVYKADRRLQAEKRQRELAAGIQLSLPLGI